MKNKGFTLIELLAVIVILAIIALIATPIVLNMINDTKEESNKRSIDMYGKAVENSIMTKQINENIIPGNYTTTDGKTLNQGSNTLTIDYDGQDVVCDKIKIYEDSEIYLESCKVGKNSKDIVRNEDGTAYTYGKKFICIAVKENTVSDSKIPQGNYEIGDEYICDVDGTNSLHFFIIGSDEGQDETVNLILNKNLGSTMSWNSAACYAGPGKGDNFTLGILNIQTINWIDTQTPVTYSGIGYGNNVYTINYTNYKARLITAEEVAQIKGTTFAQKSITDLPSWLYVNTGDAYGNQGYWTATGSTASSRNAYVVGSTGLVSKDGCYGNSSASVGMRPVITILKSSMK